MSNGFYNIIINTFIKQKFKFSFLRQGFEFEFGVLLGAQHMDIFILDSQVVIYFLTSDRLEACYLGPKLHSTSGFFGP